MPLLFRPRLAAPLLAALLVVAPAAAQETVTIRLVQTNDIDRMGEEKGRGGFARLAGVLKAERAKGPTLFLHAGDTLSPSLMSGFDKGAHVVDILNRLKPDVFVPGNHEFDFGPENFRARIAGAEFDVIASNLREKNGSPVANTKDDKIIEVEGVKLGFFGLTTEETPVASNPGDVTFAPSVKTAEAKAADLRARGADLVIAVAHTPLEVDMALAAMNKVDLIVSGHDEHLLTFYNGRTVVTESGSQATHVVVVDLAVTKAEEDGETKVSFTPNFRVVDSATATPDPDIAALVKNYQDKLNKELNVVIGTTSTEMDSRRATVRSEEAAIGNLIADAMRAAVGADVAITNGGGIRADRRYPAGAKLTRRDILSELPFGNTTVLIEASGAQIKAALENGFSRAHELGGRFPQVSGMIIEADLKQPAGGRVKSVKVGDAPLNEEKIYRVATNDFMAGGGDGYGAFVKAKRLIDEAAAQIMATQVIDHVVKAGVVAPKAEGRIVLYR